MGYTTLFGQIKTVSVWKILTGQDMVNIFAIILVHLIR